MPQCPVVCVFCGSAPGVRPRYVEAARRVGLALARDGLGMIYGGGRTGLMGAVADAVLAGGGTVVGVIPGHLADAEVAHGGLIELHVVDTMHARKALMADRASAFLALPGGVGTFEELFEVLTWAVLGLHAKPIGLLNVDGYYDPLLALVDHAVAEGFLRADHRALIRVSDDPEAVASTLPGLIPPSGPRHVDIDRA